MIAVIAGYGQVGQGLHGALNQNDQYFIYDPPQGKIEMPEIVDVLHICFPPDKDFAEQVNRLIKDYAPKLAIIHSSVIPGTTRLISHDVVYSPIRGRHSRMSQDIRHYTKILGSVNLSKALQAKEYFSHSKIKCLIFSKPETAELLKLLDNLYYAWDAMFHDFINQACQQYGVDFEDWQRFNRLYNEEAVEIPGRRHHHRAILTPPEGKLGGTCLWENAWLLQKDFPSAFLDFIVQFDQTKLKDHQLKEGI